MVLPQLVSELQVYTRGVGTLIPYKIGPTKCSGGVPELSASLCLYLDGYEPLSSKYSGLCLLEFISKLIFCYHLLAGSSSILVMGALV